MTAKEYYIEDLKSLGFSNEEIKESLKSDTIKASLNFAEKYAMHKLANQKQIKGEKK